MWNSQEYLALPPQRSQRSVNVIGRFTVDRNRDVWTIAVLVEVQRTGHVVGAQNSRTDAAQEFAFSIGGEFAAMANAQ
ncbi:hypothetical protein D3C75_1168160 [compost metagenome]